MNDWLTLCPLSGGFDLGSPGQISTARHCSRAGFRSRVNISFGSSLLPIESTKG